MRTWKTKTRLLAGFGASSALTVILGAIAWWQTQGIHRTAEEITGQVMPAMYLITQQQYLTQTRFALLEEHINAAKGEQKAAIEARIEEAIGTINAAMKSYEENIHDDADRRLFETLKSSRAAYREGYNRALALSQAGKHAPAQKLLTQLTPLREAVMKASDDAVAWNKAHGEQAARQINASVRETLTTVPVVVVLSLGIALLITTVVNRATAVPLAQAVAHLGEIAQGDLSTDTPAVFQARSDEIGMLARAKQTMIVSLRSMVQEVSNGVNILAQSSQSLLSRSSDMSVGSRSASDKLHSVAAAAEQMSVNVTTVATGIDHTATSLASVASATDQMTATINEIAGNSEKARRITAEANEQAARVTEKIHQLGEAAREIGKVTEAITEISSQTNLLALNATIEAARAGTAGKGFAVVANEIKALAQQTANATEDIKSRVEGVQSATAQGITEIEKVSSVIAEVSGIVASIAAAIEEQAVTTKDIARNVADAAREVSDANTHVAEASTVSREIARDIHFVDHATEEFATGSERLRSSSNELSALAKQLEVTAGRFRSSAV